MKSLTVAAIAMLLLATCKNVSTLDDPAQINDGNVKNELEYLKNQNNALMDSVRTLRNDLQRLQQEQYLLQTSIKRY